MARQRINFTDKFVGSLTVEKRTDYWDDKVRGLVLRVNPTGIKTWTVIYSRESDGARQRVTLGRYPAITLERARAKALKAMSAVAEGEDPAERKRVARASLTVEELGGIYIDKYAKRQKKTWAEDERILKREVYPSVGKMKASAVKRRDVLDIIDAKADAGKGAASTNILAVVRKLFNWAVDSDYLVSSPVVGVKPRSKPVRRERVLSDVELKGLWRALFVAGLSPAVADILRLLMLTGQRSGEVAGMMRSEVDIAAASWVIPRERTKNGIEHAVPLSAPALAIIEAAILRTDKDEPDAPLFSRTGQPIESNAVAQATRLKLQFSNQQWSPHDIRRTVATGMAELGVAPHIVEALLNHVSGFRAGVAGVYNRAKYEPEKRAAMTLWAEHLSRLNK
ncbi:MULTISPECIES: site-specific integrase [unclassified Mesorhizobium]|uniref:tyrosine-type recombinase/integrase n=1 Tax=unclassified Mesorhizobium TaxID=325217 RepID=UPI000FCB4D88|nr:MULTISPECIES: site-specific integrase [unclassified Mesorhizobium]RUT82669.1 site-specific integrase [Mesorhizobium sp. M7A.T.Ca.US.000.02.2.1]RUT88137.1 site-specific integrase [Mesorhizobium sp. M7A.T.Ca.US.000.02.1.1]RUT97314.1 site-specific integrase [Mesorhizobium sp. M7A.T.Ca.TU.009.02.1.1]RUU60424.1 site-specific integrase [Mesorhizobium sp. M7A.T.Ca.TU.009.01.1.1]